MSRPSFPDVVHALKGTRATRAKDNGDVAPGRPKFPAGLSRAERKIFKSLVADLETRRHATPGDREVIRVYCVLATRWEKARADVEARGEIIDYIFTDKNGKEFPRQKLNPFLAIAQQSEKSMFAILQSLGLTPTSRGKVKPAKSPEDEKPIDPFEALLGKRRAKFSVPEAGENVNVN